MSEISIVDAKVSIPPPHRYAPERPAVRAMLDRSQRVGVAVVAAGPGFLKRQVVESWARFDPVRQVAWLSLDEADDPARLWVHTVAALRVADPSFGPDLDADALIGGDGWEARATDRLLHDVGDRDGPITMVFDGVHSLTNPVSRRGIETVLRYRPAQLHVVLLTRDSAAVDLASARLSGAIVEIGERDLALDADQTFRAVASTGLDISAADADRLHAQTAGWPAGVFLTAQRSRGVGRLLPFAADQEPVLSYLRNRLIEPLDSVQRSFLLDIAPLGDVSADLCTHVTGRTDAGHLLDRMAELHLMSDPPDTRPGWHRLHGHVAAVCRHEIGATDADHAAELCRRGARWCWAEGLLDESMRIAERGADHQLMAEILLEHHQAWSAGGEAARVRSWCTVLLRADPGLVEAQLASTWASLFMGDDRAAVSAVAMLSGTESGARGTLVRGELAMIRAHVARRRGEMVRALAEVEIGIAVSHELPPGFETLYRGALPAALTLHHGVAAVWADRLDLAISLLDEARAELGWSVQALPAIHGHLAVAHWLADEPGAIAHAEVALTHLRVEPLGAADFTTLCMSVILDLGVEATTLSRVFEVAEALDEPASWVAAHVAEVHLRALSDRPAALRALRLARSVVEQCPEPGVLSRMVDRAADVVGAEQTATAGDDLTEGEERVLRMLAGPLTEREIASELHLSHNTVRTYRRRLYKKLGLVSRAEAADVVRAPRD